jgi:hypothetical protein
MIRAVLMYCPHSSHTSLHDCEAQMYVIAVEDLRKYVVSSIRVSLRNLST